MPKIELVGCRFAMAISLCLTSCGVAQLPPIERASSVLEESWRSNSAPAQSVAITFNGKIVLSRAFGFETQIGTSQRDAQISSEL